MTTPKPEKATYLIMSEYHLLNDWADRVRKYFKHQSYGIYLVGSVLKTRDFRDVDLRMIMSDKDFDKEFPLAKEYESPRGKLALMNTAFSIYAQKVTGLPVDFQFQRQTEANKDYPSPEHKRNAIGHII